MTKRLSKEGKYAIRLWDIHSQDWKLMTIDDRVPCEEKLWFSPVRPIVAKTLDSEAWVLLLEKARAASAHQTSSHPVPLPSREAPTLRLSVTCF